MIWEEKDIDQEILRFYRELVGSSKNRIRGIDIEVLGGGRQLSNENCRKLIKPIDIKETENALRELGDNKAPGWDEYNAKFLKHSWRILGRDVIRAVRDFFDTKYMHPAKNVTRFTLILKKPNAMSLKDMRHISCYTIIAKIISEVIDEKQSAFVPDKTY